MGGGRREEGRGEEGRGERGEGLIRTAPAKQSECIANFFFTAQYFH